jgi:hypothetical protein
MKPLLVLFLVVCISLFIGECFHRSFADDDDDENIPLSDDWKVDNYFNYFSLPLKNAQNKNTLIYIDCGEIDGRKKKNGSCMYSRKVSWCNRMYYKLSIASVLNDVCISFHNPFLTMNRSDRFIDHC